MGGLNGQTDFGIRVCIKLTFDPNRISKTPRNRLFETQVIQVAIRKVMSLQ